MRYTIHIDRTHMCECMRVYTHCNSDTFARSYNIYISNSISLIERFSIHCVCASVSERVLCIGMIAILDTGHSFFFSFCVCVCVHIANYVQ